MHSPEDDFRSFRAQTVRNKGSVWPLMRQTNDQRQVPFFSNLLGAPPVDLQRSLRYIIITSKFKQLDEDMRRDERTDSCRP
jgi:hypothetical protein